MVYIESEIKLNEYLDSIEKPVGFRETGIGYNDYVDMIELCFSAYEHSRLTDMLETAKESLKLFAEEGKGNTDVQSFSRIVLALGILISNGRKTELKLLWIDMMDVLCSLLKHIRNDGRLDFAVKDTMLCYLLVKDNVDKALAEKWGNELSRIDPSVQYMSFFKPGGRATRPGNIAVYLIAAESMRAYAGMTDYDYLEDQIPFHIPFFDENGMYIDPGAPMLYDSATRAQFQIAIQYGYRGKYFNEIDESLRKAGLFSLLMQSAAFEFPYGGRSNQYLFNEAYYVANCEYEAKRYKGLNDLKKAGMFKRSAHLAIKSISRWFSPERAKHIKNMFPWDSGYGTDSYGYYDKYMVSMACFLYIGMLDCDEVIEEYPCPAEAGGYIFKTSDHFHKVFANMQGQSVEIDFKCDPGHDATGLGRFHKRGFPTELALSVPFPENPAYYIDEGRNLVFEDHKNREKKKDKNPSALSVSSIVYNDEGIFRLPDFSETGKYEIIPYEKGFTVLYTIDRIGIDKIEETYAFSEEYITITAKLHGKADSVGITVPLFYTNGRDIAELSKEKNRVTVRMDRFKYIAESFADIVVTDNVYKNRNGVYKEGIFRSKGSEVSVKLSQVEDS